MPALRIGHGVHQPLEIMLQRAGGGEAVEGAHGEKRIAHPAIAVIPVAPRIRRLGQGGGDRGDHPARGLIAAQFQRDRGADDGLLPLERDRQTLRPALPIAGRLGAKGGADLLRAVRQGLIGAEDEGHLTFEVDHPPVEHMVNRRVGGQAHVLLWPDETHMVRAAGEGWGDLPPLKAWFEMHPYTG